jgi:monoamine oxidase
VKKQIESGRTTRPALMQLEIESRLKNNYKEPKKGGGAPPPFSDTKHTAGEAGDHTPFDPSLFPDDPFDYVAFAEKGLPKADGPGKVVGIIGAGASGLVAAYELLKAGHYPVVFEASDRIGGRLFTFRGFEDPGVYAEMGSMRVPPVHKTLMHYLDRFDIKTRPFPNPNKIQTCYYVGGKKEFGSPEKQVDWVANLYKKWDDAIQPFIDKMQAAWDDEARRSAAWQEIVEQYKETSFRGFLVEQGWSLEEIEAFYTVGFGVGGYGPLFQISFIEILRINVCGWDNGQLEIVGGNDKLAEGFYTSKVETEDGKKSLKELGLVFLNTPVIKVRKDQKTNELLLTTLDDEVFACDDLIVTAQLRAVQMEIDIEKSLLSPEKWQAIYSSHFMSSGKIFLETETAFWKEPGQELTTTITDLPIRAAYLFDFEDTESGLICSSYTWEDDARKWHASDIEDRAEQSIDFLEMIYGKDSIRPHVVSAYGFSWEEMPGYRAAFKQYYPGQNHYYKLLAEPENHIHFAGDSVSYAGGWIEGALQSGLRAARQVVE